MKKENISLINSLLDMCLKVKRELRASRNEQRADMREKRANEVHTKKYFGREIK